MIEDRRKYGEAEVAERDRRSIGAAEEEQEAKCEERVRKTLLPRKPEILETSMEKISLRAVLLARGSRGKLRIMIDRRREGASNDVGSREDFRGYARHRERHFNGSL